MDTQNFILKKYFDCKKVTKNLRKVEKVVLQQVYVRSLRYSSIRIISQRVLT